MKDFASAAMLRLVRLGLRRQGLDAPPPPQAPSLVPLADKRALLQAVMQRHGPAVLLKIGEAVQDAPDEPTLTALIAARDPADLVLRWQRLERFVHSRHRVQQLAGGAGWMRLRHVSLQPGETPLPAEDLLVWGLLAALLRRIGAEAVAIDVDALFEATDTVQIRWQPAAAVPHRPVPARADTLVAVRERLARDCAAPWSLPRLAADLGLAPRTLQRRLAAEATSFSALWTEVRLAASARLLAAGAESTAQIGYLCGFADQAHFTRCFHRHTALTPARYRSEFAVAR